jgi:hypothetical protein
VKQLILKIEPVRWRELEFSQPFGVKKTTPERVDRLKKSIVNNGFGGFKVWQDGEAVRIIDGHYRYIALEQLAREGVEVPEYLTATFLDVHNMDEVKKLIFAFNSHYADFDPDELAEFIGDMDVAELLTEFDIPALEDITPDLEGMDSFTDMINPEERGYFEFSLTAPISMKPFVDGKIREHGREGMLNILLNALGHHD